MGDNCNECNMTVITKQGERGIQGPLGPPGRIGPPGEAVIGPQGIQGAVGPAGAAGPAGGAAETMVTGVVPAVLSSGATITPADLVLFTKATTTIHFLKIATNMWVIHFETRPLVQTNPTTANPPLLQIDIDVSAIVTTPLTQIPYGVASVVPLTINDFQNYDLKYCAGARVVLSGQTLSIIFPIDTVNFASDLIISGSCFAKT